MMSALLTLLLAPAVPCDLDRFPTEEETAFSCAAADTWVQWLKLQAVLRPWRGDVEEALIRAKRVAHVWDLLSEWQQGWKVADELRCALGEEDWFLGKMPAPVDVWRIEERR